MEESKEMCTQEKGEEKTIMEIDVIAQVTVLRVSELLRTVNGKTERILNKINQEKEKACVQHLAFLHSCCGVLLLIRRKIQTAGRLLSLQLHCHTHTQKKETYFFLLPYIIYSLPPQLVTEMYYCTISPSFPLTLDDLYSINYLALSDVSRNSLNCFTEKRDRTNTNKVSTITCLLRLANIPSLPTIPQLCCMVLTKILFFSSTTGQNVSLCTRCTFLPLSSTWMSGFVRLHNNFW